MYLNVADIEGFESLGFEGIGFGFGEEEEKEEELKKNRDCSDRKLIHENGRAECVFDSSAF